MKEQPTKFGWTGWAVVGLVAVLVVGAIVAANTQAPASEEEDAGQEAPLDASGDDVLEIGGDSDPGAVGNTTTPADSMPQSGAVGQEEFIY